MKVRCRCSAPLPYDFERLGCVSCGEPCCPVCGFLLESAWHCAACTDALLSEAGGVVAADAVVAGP